MATVDWRHVDTVLLDMDGTLLDLRFDNEFWLERVPAAYAARHRLAPEAARERLFAHMQSIRGTLNWYCVDYWSEALGLDIIRMTREASAGICMREDAAEFLAAVRATGRALYLLTNAHPATLAIKLEQVDLGDVFDALVSSHPLGAPKEEQAFWTGFVAAHPVNPARSLFIDDNAVVLAAAQAFGIGQLLAVRQGDSSRAAVDTAPFTGLDRFGELLPVPPRRS